LGSTSNEYIVIPAQAGIHLYLLRAQCSNMTTSTSVIAMALVL
jgi:hypothetical protein